MYSTFFQTSELARIHGYLNIMYKYAGKEMDIMIKNFTNTAVYAVTIVDIIAIAMQVAKFYWSYSNNAQRNLENILMARDEVFKTADKNS